MRLYRIGSSQYPLFDGYGAMSNGGRWNSPGFSAIYAAASLAAARLEMLVHIGRARRPRGHAWISIEIPDDVPMTILEASDLPAGWDHPTDRDVARAVGDAWFESNASAILRVPSVAAGGDHVFVIDQNHLDFARMRASSPSPLVWDDRLFGR